jgi:Fe2+ or Zn2+ uptake regulation protein
MKTVDELTELFRAEGLRVTPQRQAIFRLLEGNDQHPTVEAVHEAVRGDMPTISLKTVYQTVNDLAAMGQVELLDLGTGSARIDPNVEHRHHHLICTECGAVRDVTLDARPPAVPARFRRGFTVAAVEVNYRGVCDACASDAR